MALVPCENESGGTAKSSDQLALFEGPLQSELGKMLAPTIQQMEKVARDVYQFGIDLYEDTCRWISRESKDDDEAEECSITIASREIALYSGFSSVCSFFPSASSSLILSSVNIGPFSWITFLGSGSAAVYLLYIAYWAWDLNSEHNGRRHAYRAAAAAATIASAGQVAFLVLNSTAVVRLHVLPFVTVSSFFAPMMNPFVVLHLFAFSTELPFMIYVLGRVSGRDWEDMRTTHIMAGLFGVCSIFSASTKVLWLRWFFLIGSAFCGKEISKHLKALPAEVEHIVPARTPKIWSENVSSCVIYAWGAAFGQILVQSLGPGYLGVLSQATQMDLFALGDVLLYHVVPKKILKDNSHVCQAEMYLIQRGQPAIAPAAGGAPAAIRRPG